MRNTVFMSTLALALAVSGTAFAQSSTGATNTPSPNAAKQQNASQPSVLTIDKLKQDLQTAGFTEVKVLQDAFLIQAKTKDGNPIMLTVGPNGMSALEMSKSNGAGQDRTTGQAHPDNSPAAAPAKPAQH
jgi:hypothetical protein